MNYILFFLKINFLKINKLIVVDDKQSFRELSLKLHDKKLFNLTITTLNLLYKMFNTKLEHSVRIFLSCFMINSFPDVMIGNETELEQNLKKDAKQLIDLSNKIGESNSLFFMKYNCYKFMKLFDDFVKNFNTWKELDKLKIIHDLCTIYFELEADINKRKNTNNPNQQVFINDNLREQKNILKKIDKLNGRDEFDKIKNQVEQYKKSIEELYKNIGSTLHKAFWDDLKSKLSVEEPDYLVILPLLDEVKTMIINCVPNHQQIHNEIDEKIDIEFLGDMIKRKVLSPDYIINLVHYVISFIKRFQSASDDKETLKWENSIKDLFANGCKYEEFFPIFFKGVFERFDKIMKEAHFVRQTELFEQIKEIKNKNN